jgi:hypothetical protein
VSTEDIICLYFIQISLNGTHKRFKSNRKVRVRLFLIEGPSLPV